jgi:N-formylglutamate amidohydrolase
VHDKILTIDGEEGQSIPLILDSPHSGQFYPKNFNHQATFSKLRQAEDSYVDELFDYAVKIGAVMLKAEFPRSYIDPNRAETDFFLKDIINQNNIMYEIDFKPSIKSEMGIGLIWLKIPPEGDDMYKNKITLDELMNRVKTYHRPYHEALRRIMNKTHKKYNKFYHINCHSMQENATAMSTQIKGTSRPDFVIGDRDGNSCDKKFTNVVVECLRDLNYEVMVNDPYKGAELVSAYSDPNIQKHSLQIEINRKLYMNEETRVKHDGFNILKHNLSVLLNSLKTWLK